MDDISFTIRTVPRTKKNSQRIARRKDGTPFVLPSDKYREYERECAPHIPRLVEPISDRVNVKAVFYMPTRRRVDLVNLEEALLDILVRYGVLEDDNSGVVASMDGSRVGYDKLDPRTEVEITRI